MSQDDYRHTARPTPDLPDLTISRMHRNRNIELSVSYGGILNDHARLTTAAPCVYLYPPCQMNNLAA